MKMAITAGKTVFVCTTLALVFLLSGCGLTQTVTDGTLAATKFIFFKQVKILHLDIRAREAVNNNDAGIPLSTVVRIYQLKDRTRFDHADFPTLFAADSQAIKADLLEQRDIWLQPGGAVVVDMPMEAKVQFIAVAAMFLAPDQMNNTWRVVLSRDDLDPDKARVIEASGNSLTLMPLKDK